MAGTARRAARAAADGQDKKKGKTPGKAVGERQFRGFFSRKDFRKERNTGREGRPGRYSSRPRERQNAAREDSIAERREKRKGQSVTNNCARVRTREGGGPQALRAQAFQPFTVERRHYGRRTKTA